MNVLSIFNLPFSSLLLNYGSTPVLRAVCTDAAGNIWSCQERRGLIFFGGGRQPLLYTHVPSLSGLSPLLDISCLVPCSEEKGSVWVMPEFDSRIYVMRAEGGEPRILHTYDLGTDNFARAVHEDENHTLWIATTMGLVVKQSGGALQSIVGTIPTDGCSITTDDDGRLWIACQWTGLYAYDVSRRGKKVQLQETLHLTHENSKLSTDHIASIAYDSRRHLLWIATAEGGIFTYDYEKRKLKDYTCNFVSYINTRLQNIVVDRFGMVWVMTNRSLLRFQPNGNIVTTFTTEDDIDVKQYKHNAIYYDGINSLYVGGYGGLSKIDIRHATYNLNRQNAPLVSNVKVNAESVLYGKTDHCNLNQADRTITLASNSTNIEIDFTTCDYAHPKKIIYGYQLKGVDKEVIYTTTLHHYAFYNRLPKGSYKLVVIAYDANGNRLSRETIYTVHRLPAFYETWWAYCVYFLIAAALVFFAFRRYRLRQLQKLQAARKQMEYEKEEEMTKTKLQYFTNVSHDFLTPITIISCIIDDILITTPDHDGSSHNLIGQLDRIKVNLRRLKRLIQQVLDFRKIESGKMSLEVKQCDLVQFIRNVYNDYFEPLVKQKEGLHFVFDTMFQELPAYVDEDKLDRIIINLLSNAYKYTDRGEIRITLRQVDINNRHWAIIRVSDTGTGIRAKDMPHIFDRFFTSEHHAKESNGIGLSLVRELVALHHGSIDVESEEGKGTAFTLRLPIDRQSYSGEELRMSQEIKQVDDCEVNLPDTAVKESDGGVSGGRMLIVEDNTELLNLMRKIFSRYHNVFTATNGEEGLDAVRNTPPDIIISDVMMPVMDGLQMCRRLKQDPETSHIPIILLTARSNPEDRIACYNAGADGYITKPFELSVLKARIDNFLRDKNLQQKEQAHAEEFRVDSLKVSDIDKQFMQKVIDFVEAHIGEEKLDVNFMAEALFMSNSTLYRKIKGITGLSPVAFIRNVRLKYAYRKLVTTDLSITSIAFDCGFSTPSYFSTCFKAEFGITPAQARMKNQ